MVSQIEKEKMLLQHRINEYQRKMEQENEKRRNVENEGKLLFWKMLDYLGKHWALYKFFKPFGNNDFISKLFYKCAYKYAVWYIHKALHIGLITV